MSMMRQRRSTCKQCEPRAGRLWVSANTADPARTRLDLYNADLRYLGSREGLPRFTGSLVR